MLLMFFKSTVATAKQWVEGDVVAYTGATTDAVVDPIFTRCRLVV